MRRNTQLAWALAMGLVCLVAPPMTRAQKRTNAKKLMAGTLLPSPAQIQLQGAYATARLLADERKVGGTLRDVSAEATFVSANPKIATVDDRGTVEAKQDGTTAITIRVSRGKATLTCAVPVTVRGVAKTPVPPFQTAVMPVLIKAGCTMGACHGANAGKGGFKLSLLGYDPDADYESITRFAGARRVSPAAPDNSLLLRKAVFAMKHGGGKRFEVGSPSYRILRDWIAGGMPAPKADEPAVTRLEVTPSSRTLTLGQTQRIRVVARYANGMTRDVSTQTLFTSGDGSILDVSPSGQAKVVGPGEGPVVIRYQGVMTTARIVSPYGAARPFVAKSRPNGQPEAPHETIDRLVFQKIAALGLEPSSRCSDEEFLRRVYLDVVGLLPKPETVRAFLADRDPQKRNNLIETLLASPEYVDYWSVKWGDFLRNSRDSLTDKGMYAFHHWIRQSVAQNKPWDTFTRELLLAQGSAYANGAVNYYRAGIEPESTQIAPALDLGETTAQLFLGVRLQCARCHNHPFEKWTQKQFYQIGGFFSRLEAKNGASASEKVIFAKDEGNVQHPKTGREILPAALDAPEVKPDYASDRRAALVEWMTAPNNPFFAQVIANRLWKHYLGRGLVEPVDDLRVTNPPTNEPLFQWLAAQLRRERYDMKQLMRHILRSEVYQLSSRSVPRNERDNRYYSHFLVKRMTAEQILDALSEATGVPEKFPGYPLGTRALQLPDPMVASYFLDVFGRPPRHTTCECERVNEANLPQALNLINGDGLNAKLAASEGRLTALLKASRPAPEMVEEIYLATLSRLPTSEERQRMAQRLETATDRRKAAEDLLWALMNTKEFLFNR